MGEVKAVRTKELTDAMSEVEKRASKLYGEMAREEVERTPETIKKYKDLLTAFKKKYDDYKKVAGADNPLTGRYEKILEQEKVIVGLVESAEAGKLRDAMENVETRAQELYNKLDNKEIERTPENIKGYKDFLEGFKKKYDAYASSTAVADSLKNRYERIMKQERDINKLVGLVEPKEEVKEVKEKEVKKAPSLADILPKKEKEVVEAKPPEEVVKEEEIPAMSKEYIYGLLPEEINKERFFNFINNSDNILHYMEKYTKTKGEREAYIKDMANGYMEFEKKYGVYPIGFEYKGTEKWTDGSEAPQAMSGVYNYFFMVDKKDPDHLVPLPLLRKWAEKNSDLKALLDNPEHRELVLAFTYNAGVGHVMDVLRAGKGATALERFEDGVDKWYKRLGHVNYVECFKNAKKGLEEVLGEDIRNLTNYTCEGKGWTKEVVYSLEANSLVLPELSSWGALAILFTEQRKGKLTGEDATLVEDTVKTMLGAFQTNPGEFDIWAGRSPEKSKEVGFGQVRVKVPAYTTNVEEIPEIPEEKIKIEEEIPKIKIPKKKEVPVVAPPKEVAEVAPVYITISNIPKDYLNTPFDATVTVKQAMLDKEGKLVMEVIDKELRIEAIKKKPLSGAKVLIYFVGKPREEERYFLCEVTKVGENFVGTDGTHVAEVDLKTGTVWEITPAMSEERTGINIPNMLKIGEDREGNKTFYLNIKPEEIPDSAIGYYCASGKTNDKGEIKVSGIRKWGRVVPYAKVIAKKEEEEK